MANTGLLILTNPTKIVKLLPAIKKHVMKTLYIQYFPDKNILVPQIPRGPGYSQIVSNIYALTSSISNCLDVRVLLSSLKANVQVINTKKPVELVIFDRTYPSYDANVFMQDYLGNTSMGCKFITLGGKEDDDDESPSRDKDHKEEQKEKIYNHVVLGGTFDRLHNGHKIFISEAILRCANKLTIGVTKSEMLKDKILWELIQPCKKRVSHLKEFTEDVEPNIKYNIVEISDVYGPTIVDPDIDMIVVSEETRRGGVKINEERGERNFKLLDIFVVRLAKDSSAEDHEDMKISSSNHRIRLLGSRLKKPDLSGKPLRPYIIGLTGGITSGKSSIAQKLQTLGAGLINCDTVAHTLYEPGKKCFNLIIDAFGREYLTPDGQIDRKLLGQLVFNDKTQLEKLNKLMWPAIREETEKLIGDLYKEGFEIVVVEAAVLIQAGWQSICHEIWTSIITHDEAIKRLMERNKLTEEEAQKRILVQPTNQVQVENAHVIFSTMWSHEITQKQVEKAWNIIKAELKENSKD